MSGNTTAPGNNNSLLQYIQSVIAGHSSIIYPDEQICQYVKAAVAAGYADVPGAPSLDVAQMVRAAIGT